MHSGEIIILAIDYAARTVVLTLLLCLMVKLQKLDFYFLGLAGSAAVACVLDTIPFAGHYLAVPVLYLCIWKVTGASLMPDAVFTVAVSYALMFLTKVLLFTALVGNLHLGADRDGMEMPEPPELNATLPPRAGTNAIRATNAAPAKNDAKSADEILKDITVRGATKNGDKSMLLISANKKIYELAMGEQTVVPLPSGSCRIRLMNVDATWATVEVNGEAAYLGIHQTAH